MTDAPDESDLVVPVERVAARLGVTAPTAAQRAVIADAIRDAQADVVAYLGRPITPTTVTETGRWPFAGGWRLDLAGDESEVEYVSVEPEIEGTGPAAYATGYFTVTYRMGLDVANDPALRPILRYVLESALNLPEVLTLYKSTGAQGELRTVSAEGQSVTFGSATLGGGGQAGSGAPGALPTLSSLDRWRVAGRRVYQGSSRLGVREGW